MKIKEVCYGCAYFDTTLPKGRAYKCYTSNCPARNLSEEDIKQLLRKRKTLNKRK